MNVALLLAEGFEEIEAVTPVDLLRRAEIPVTILGITAPPIRGGHGISIGADQNISDIDAADFDGVIIPGGMPGAQNIFDSTDAKEFILSVYRKNGLVAAICAAPAVVLEPLGFLKGIPATSFPSFAEKMDDAQYCEDRVVTSGRIITSRGAGTAAEFSREIIKFYCGPKTAADVADRTLQK